MYDAFLYVVANDGVDTSSAYSFQGKVSVGIERCVHSLLTPEGLCFNTQSTLVVHTVTGVAVSTRVYMMPNTTQARRISHRPQQLKNSCVLNTPILSHLPPFLHPCSNHLATTKRVAVEPPCLAPSPSPVVMRMTSSLLWPMWVPSQWLWTPPLMHLE